MKQNLGVEESIPSTLDENPGTSTAIHRGPENRLNAKHIFPPPRSFVMDKHAERKFKRNTERMSFVITCRAWKALFQEKNLLH